MIVEKSMLKMLCDKIYYLISNMGNFKLFVLSLLKYKMELDDDMHDTTIENRINTNLSDANSIIENFWNINKRKLKLLKNMSEPTNLKIVVATVRYFAMQKNEKLNIASLRTMKQENNQVDKITRWKCDLEGSLAQSELGYVNNLRQYPWYRVHQRRQWNEIPKKSFKRNPMRHKRLMDILWQLTDTKSY